MHRLQVSLRLIVHRSNITGTIARWRTMWSCGGIGGLCQSRCNSCIVRLHHGILLHWRLLALLPLINAAQSEHLPESTLVLFQLAGNWLLSFFIGPATILALNLQVYRTIFARSVAHSKWETPINGTCTVKRRIGLNKVYVISTVYLFSVETKE